MSLVITRAEVDTLIGNQWNEAGPAGRKLLLFAAWRALVERYGYNDF